MNQRLKTNPKWLNSDPKNFVSKNRLTKFSVFLQDFLEQSKTITETYYYKNLLNKLRQKTKKKRHRKLVEGMLFLRDSAPAHKSLTELQIGFELVDHPPHPLHSASSKYILYKGSVKCISLKRDYIE